MVGDNLSVLVVDDDGAIRSLLRTLLKRTNADVECVPDGSDALARLKSRAYSVVILDLMLPTVDGFEVLQQVSESMPELLKRIIVLTAVSQSSLKHLHHEKAVWKVMRKPFDIDELLRSVEACAAQPVSHAM
jgi:DNA-binding response OmpR family regulator